MSVPLSPLQRQFLSQSSPAAAALDLGGRLAIAQSLQWAGRVATGHVRLVTQPLDGDSLTVVVGAGARLAAPSAPGSAVLEFDADGSVQPGAIPVLIGPTPAETAASLARALSVQLGRLLTATAHPTDTAVVDLAARAPGAPLALSTTAPGSRIVVQANDEQEGDADRVLYMLLRTVTAEDVARTRVRMDTGLRSLSNVLLTTYAGASDSTSKPYNGVLTTSGGVLELTIGTAAGALVAGNVLQLLVLGSP